MSLLDWSPNPASNTSKPNIDWSEGQLPSTVNGSARAMMADVAAWLTAPVLNGNTTISGTLTGTTATFSGTVTFGGISGFSAANDGAGNPVIYFKPGQLIGYNVTGNYFDFAIGAGGMRLSPTALAITGALSATGAITQAGNQVWHAGNFSPSGYAALTGATFSGNINVAGAAYRIDSLTAITSGGGWINAYSGGTGFRVLSAAGAIQLFAVSEAGAVSANGITAASLASSGAITQAGNQVWHAGNLTPSAYAPLASPNFTGAPTFAGGIMSLFASGNDSVIQFDAGDGILFDKVSNKFRFVIGGTAIASIDATGTLRVAGSIIASTTP